MKKVTIYSLSTCPWCRKAKQYFDRHRVAYDNTDYDLADSRDQERVKKEMSDLGAEGFPVVKIGREVVVGYSPERYDELLQESPA